MLSFISGLDFSKILSIIASVIACLVFIYSIIKYREVQKIENKILKGEEELDSISEKSKNPYLTNDQLLRAISVKKEPVLRKLNLLRQERQFILDKIPLIGLFKK